MTRARIAEWRGDDILRSIERASHLAIDQVTRDAAEAAKGSHSWRSRRGQLESEIVAEPAERQGDQVVGKFGTTQRRGFYGLFMERRTPFLRPAADLLFPQLAKRIKRRR